MAANRPVRNRKAPSKLSYSVLAGDSLAGEFVQGLKKSTQSKSSHKRRRGSDDDVDSDDTHADSNTESAKVKFKGVINTGRGRFRANITIDGKTQYPGTFDTPKEAARAYDRAAIQAGKPTSKLNFLDQVPKNYIPKKKKLASTNTTGYRGVSRRGNRFQACISIGGKRKQRCIGTFDTAKEAAQAYDRAAIQAGHLTCELNFSTAKKKKKMKTKTKTKKQTTTKVPILRKKKEKKKTGTTSSSSSSSTTTTTTTTTTTKSITTGNNHHSSLQILAILSGHVNRNFE